MTRVLARSFFAALCAASIAQASADSVARGALALSRIGHAAASVGVPRLVLATPDPAIASPAQVGSAWDAGAWRLYGRGIAASARNADANVVAIPLGPFASDPTLEAWTVEPLVAGVVRSKVLAAVVPSAAPSADALALHELDLPPLEAALRGGAGAVACTLPGAPWVAALCRDHTVLASALEHDVRFDGFVTGSSWSEMTTISRVRAAARTAGLFGRAPLPVTAAAQAEISRHLVQSGAVLLKNDGAILPVGATTRSLLVVGASDAAVAALRIALPATAIATSPADPEQASRAAAHAQAALVFLGAPDPNESALIAAVTAANPRTAVVLERDPSAMDWAASVPAVLLAWAPVLGTDAGIANVIAGKSAPAGRLSTATAGYPVGAGLTYTSFVYSGFSVAYGHGATPVTVSFLVRNSGMLAGTAVPRLTLVPPGGGDARLAAFSRVTLAPGGERRVSIPLGARAFAVWSPSYKAWYVGAGEYEAAVLEGAAPPVLTGPIRVVSR